MSSGSVALQVGKRKDKLSLKEQHKMAAVAQRHVDEISHSKATIIGIIRPYGASTRQIN